MTTLDPTAVAALTAAIDTVGICDASEHIRSADDLAPALLAELGRRGWQIQPADDQLTEDQARQLADRYAHLADDIEQARRSTWTHGSRYGREHHSIRQHLVEDHGFTWLVVAGMSDGAVHGWHDGEHGETWSYAKPHPHPQAGDGPPAPPTIADAKALATGAHSGQVDKAGKPYINHPRAVATLLADRGRHAIIAGWLHDVVEDSDVTCADLAAAGYPPEVVAAVDAVTRRDGEPYMTMIERAAGDPLGRLVKLADNADNSRPDRLALLPEGDRERLRKRYERARAVLTAAREGVGQ